jgi:hypothetical protein
MVRACYKQSIILIKSFQRDAELHQDPSRHMANRMLLEALELDFVNWLGESKYMHGLTTIPASRFSKHDANGLWEYSPLLCATGMVEGLTIMQRVMMNIWDNIPEPTLAVHLHNMLVKKGYLKVEVEPYATLEGLLKHSFFPAGAPTEGFCDALVARVGQGPNSRASSRQRQAVIRDVTSDIHRLLDPNFNRLFRNKSTLMMYHDAGWLPEHILDSEVIIPSALYVHRLINTERTINPATGETRLKETELVKRAKAQGESDAAMLEAASFSISGTNMNNETFEAAMRRIDLEESNKYTRAPPQRNPYHVSEQKKHGQLQGCSLLEQLQLDVFADVCGRDPLSSLNYVWITCQFMILFIMCEDRLRETRHPLWVRFYEQPVPQLRQQKRFALVVAMMKNEDDQALKIFAEIFENTRMGTLGYIFWDDLRTEESGRKPAWDGHEIPTNQCSVM